MQSESFNSKDEDPTLDSIFSYVSNNADPDPQDRTIGKPGFFPPQRKTVKTEKLIAEIQRLNEEIARREKEARNLTIIMFFVGLILGILLMKLPGLIKKFLKGGKQ